ncbi:hypothetical protein DAI22_09g015133 [Oryza sativa Japonica Group]|nr:hypothetical protein DAI22_09g015133 [Oryza sativa Japonica Group]
MVHHGISLLGTLFLRAIPTVYIGTLRILDPLLHIYIMMTSNYVLLNPEEKTDKTIVQVYMLLPTVCLIISHAMV